MTEARGLAVSPLALRLITGIKGPRRWWFCPRTSSPRCRLSSLETKNPVRRKSGQSGDERQIQPPPWADDTRQSGLLDAGEVEDADHNADPKQDPPSPEPVHIEPSGTRCPLRVNQGDRPGGGGDEGYPPVSVKSAGGHGNAEHRGRRPRTDRAERERSGAYQGTQDDLARRQGERPFLQRRWRFGTRAPDVSLRALAFRSLCLPCRLGRAWDSFLRRRSSASRRLVASVSHGA